MTVKKRLLLTLLLSCFLNAYVQGETVDKGPRPALLLGKTEHFVVQDAWNSVALYKRDDTNPVRRFLATAQINKLDVTSDEQLMLILCEREVAVWNIQTGENVWRKTSSESGLGYIYDGCFAHDGKSLVVCNEATFAVVFNAVTGQSIGRLTFPPMQTSILSAALSPNGTSGVLVNLGGRLFTFETTSGMIRNTRLTGLWPVRYSMDGKYVAFVTRGSRNTEQLRIVTVQDFTEQDVGQFNDIGYIKPIWDGSFLVSARVGGRNDEHAVTVGVKCDPKSGELKEVWRLPVTAAENRTDFDETRLIGVSTDFRLVTRLIDLRTGEAQLIIDNSANHRAIVMTYTTLDAPWWDRYFRWLALLGGAASVFALSLALLFRLFRRRRL